MAKHNILGKHGEEEARQYLSERHYTILSTNWRHRRYELDIVAVRDDQLVVVEVKTRSQHYLLSPADAVDTGKIRRLVCAAEMYVQQFEISLPVRFDIITVVQNDDNSHTVEHIENAFYAPLS